MHNWAAAHSLNNSSRFAEQIRISHFNDQILRFGAVLIVDRFDFNAIGPGCRSVHRGVNLCGACFYFLLCGKGDRLRRNRRGIQCAVYAGFRIGLQLADREIVVEIAVQFAGAALLALDNSADGHGDNVAAAKRHKLVCVHVADAVPCFG